MNSRNLAPKLSAPVTRFLCLAAVVCPVKDGLSLASPTFEIARFAVLPNRRHVARDCPPASNLAGIVSGPAAHVVAAIPLEPSTWILLVDPSAATPDREGLRGVHAETIQPRVMPLGAQPGAGEPAPWILLLAIRHVLPAEDAEPQHLLRRQIGREPRCEVSADRLGAPVNVAALHPIGDDDLLDHRVTPGSATSARPDAASDRPGRPDTRLRSAGCDGRTA